MLHILSLATPVAFADAERYSEVEQALMLESVMDCMGAAEVVVVEYAEGFMVLSMESSRERESFLYPSFVMGIVLGFILSYNIYPCFFLA